jgi:pimeloyl-ACP methyl ester carboxylesterase/putative sterol carrier protein
MALDLARPDWQRGLLDELNRDEEWQTAAHYFPVKIQVEYEDGSFTVDTRDGKAVSVVEGEHVLGSDLTVAAPNREWQRVLDGETDWFQGMSPGLGEMSLRGNAVGAMRNVKAMWLFLKAMSRVGKPKVAAPGYSPDHQPSGKATTGHYVDVDGLRTYYEEAGEGVPIVCIHAACQDTLMYRLVLDGLSDEFRVISVDAPAHGKTLEPDGGPFRNISNHADFTEKFMDAIGVEKAVIVGCSMGGNEVLELAARRPDYYRAVVSSEGADYTPTVSDFLLEMLLLNGPQILECWSQSLIGNRTPPDRYAEVVWQIRRVTPETAAGDLIGYAGFDRREDMKGIQSPVLLLRGDADWLVHQEMVEETASRIPQSQIAALKGTGHYPMIENPYEYCEAIRTFLKDEL